MAPLTFSAIGANRRHMAFTLIELLIVVAIIAILAAIAVPNFLEAQTRSKVTRARADMRTIATAMEAYAVDYNHHPRGILPGWNPRERWGWGFLPEILTTPVAYLTDLPIDPFNFYYSVPPNTTIWGAVPGTPTTRFRIRTREPYTLQIGDGPAIPPEQWIPDHYAVYLRDVGANEYTPYFISSPGPNKTEDFNPPYRPAIYDPTNGSISVGDLVYLGGSSQDF